MRILGLCGYKQSGKSTLAQVAKEEFHFVTVGFADELKRIIKALWPAFTIEHMYGGKKEEVVEEYGKSFREVAQHVGTDLFRAYDPDVWVRSTRQTIEHYEHQMGKAARPLVIEDIRFDNEAALIHELGGEVWEVVRPEKDDRFERDTHKSELGLLASSVDMAILNAFILDDYTAMCRRKLEEFVNER